MGSINWLAVVAATVAMFAIGGIWFSRPLFFRQWQAAAGLSDEQLKARNMPLVFGITFVLTLVMAAILAYFLSTPEMTVGLAVAYATAAGLGFAALGLGIIALFEARPLSYHLINGGYLTVGFAVMGLILGLWR